MSSLRESTKAITLRTYKCYYCDASTKAYDRPDKCAYCHRVGAMDIHPKSGSVEWLAAVAQVEVDTTRDLNVKTDAGSRQWMADQMTLHFKQLQDVREAGQKEYAHDEEDAFANFRRLSKSLGLPMEKVLMVYAQKHMDGIYSHLKGHVSQREPVQGRIKDLITYLHLLWGMIDAGV